MGTLEDCALRKYRYKLNTHFYSRTLKSRIEKILQYK